MGCEQTLIFDHGIEEWGEYRSKNIVVFSSQTKIAQATCKTKEDQQRPQP